MKEEDAETTCAYFALTKLHILPQELIKMTRREKAVIYAFISIYAELAKKRAGENKQKKQVKKEVKRWEQSARILY